MKDKLKDFFVKNKKIAITATVALVLVIVGAIVLLVSCGGDNEGANGENNTTANTSGEHLESKTCTVEVKTEGGMPFEKMEIFVYKDSTLEDLVAAAKTDENGKMTFESKNDVTKYAVVLKDIPDGYVKKDYFALTGENTQIVLGTEILPLGDMSNTKFELGSVVKDFTVTTPDGTEVTISKLMEKKKAVVLNFFYLACQPCMNEFPYMQEAYAGYSDDIAIIAMTPVDKDNDAIAKFIKDYGITFYVASCDSQWERMMELTAYPTTVVIDRYGVMSLIHKGSVPNAETFSGVFAYYTADNYKQILTKNVEDIAKYEAEVGTVDNPIQILPDAADFEATLKAGEEKYFEIPKVSNMILTINDTDAYIIYNEETYKPVDGVLAVTISAPDTYTPAKFVIGNAGSAEKTVKATLGAVLGSMVNPYTMNLGEFLVNVTAGNEQGVYYTYTATEPGTLTVQCINSTSSVNYDYTLYNLNTYANRNLSSDGDTSGIPTVTIDVNAGDVVQFSVGTLPNENNEYPAGEFTFKAQHVAGEVSTGENTETEVTYSVTVTDGNGNALSGVAVIIDSKELTTDASGVAKTTLKAGSYGVRVTAPSGYGNPNGSLTVTADSPSLAVKLTKASTAKTTYSVKVVDENDKAIKGVTVVVGGSYGTTDSNGSVSFSLTEDNYSAAISLPSGYTSDSTSFSFNGGTSLTVKIKKGSSENTTKPTDTTVDYTVNVVDYKNKGQSGVMVMFYKGSNVVAMQQTNASGVATVKLEKGDYTVEAVLSEDIGCDATNTVLTSNNRTTTVKIAPKATKINNEVYFDATGAYYIDLGGQYVEIPESDKTDKDFFGKYVNSGGNAFFIFETEKSGMYKITTSNPYALISYWGNSTTYVPERAIEEEIEHTDTSVTLNIKESKIPEDGSATVILGVKGTSECIIIVERIGNAILDEYDIPYDEYVPKKSPTKQSLTINESSLKYIDITAKHSYSIVYDSEGIGHLGDISGPKVYVNFGENAPYSLSMLTMYGDANKENSGTTALRKIFYKADGSLDKKEDYTACIRKFISCRDSATGLYPLTQDIEYMLKNGGEYAEWWGLSNSEPNLNKDIAWMFACCYVE